MFRKLGFGSGSKKRPQKKRLSPAPHERPGDDTATTPPPSYLYAMNEYALTGPSASQRPTNIDDEGKIRPSFSMMDEEEDDDDAEGQQQQQQQSYETPQQQGQTPVPDEGITANNIRLHEQQQQHGQAPDGILRSSSSTHHGNQPYSPYNRRRYLSPKADYFSYDEEDTVTTATFGVKDGDASTQAASRRSPAGLFPRERIEPMMPDATYEEWYGDAYVGGPIRYIYPSGYQSMRPRGGPWKLSIVVCLLFTWLSVFVIGYCADSYSENVGSSNNNNNGNDDNQYNNGANDDAIVIDEKWCGSRLLYWLWVISMLVTALSSAYCSVIGYIKVRDFVVANTRSQPPGIMMVGEYSMSGANNNNSNKGNSDYYVPIGNAGSVPATTTTTTNNYRLQQTHPSQYTKTIYQADGTPQFWGNQIYRPTQAAVHTVSR